MADNTRICKVCGDEYPYCKTEFNGNIFRWQDVACCPEHAAMYFAEVEKARSGNAAPSNDEAANPEIDIDDIDDIDDDDDIDDEEDDEEDEDDEE